MYLLNKDKTYKPIFHPNTLLQLHPCPDVCKPIQTTFGTNFVTGYLNNYLFAFCLRTSISANRSPFINIFSRGNRKQSLGPRSSE